MLFVLAVLLPFHDRANKYTTSTIFIGLTNNADSKEVHRVCGVCVCVCVCVCVWYGMSSIRLSATIHTLYPQ